MRLTVTVTSIGVSLGLALGVFGQERSFDPETQRVLNKQAGEMFGALQPAVRDAASSTVEVRVRGERIAYGTVIGPGKVLAKWSELEEHAGSLICRAGDGKSLPATVRGIYRESDLATLEVKGLEAKPMKFDANVNLQLGQFLVLARPDGEAGSMGVVSVLPRSLREGDRAFLGVGMESNYEGPGVKVTLVRGGTGAERAGLKEGDIITGIRGRAVSGNFELVSALQRLKPGETVRIKYRRGKEQRAATVELGGRPEERPMPWSRMERMNEFGGHEYSEVRDDFRHVIQSDMQIDPKDCGAPVVDLQGRVVGLAVARAGRIKSFIIPSDAIVSLLKKEPAPARLEERAGRAVPVGDEELAGEEDPFEIMRRHMEEMQRTLRAIEESEP